MEWGELWGREREPADTDIREFTSTPLWDDLAAHMRDNYNSKPKRAYSGCSMGGGVWKGWNVKYKKSGKALCTLYPKRGYFIASIAVAAADEAEAELLLPMCGDYTRELYARSKPGSGYRSLPMEVKDESILKDTKAFIALRAARKK